MKLHQIACIILFIPAATLYGLCYAIGMLSAAVRHGYTSGKESVFN